MNQSKKILAAMLAIPATVIVAGQVEAAEVTTEFEIKNSFVGESGVANVASSPTIEAKTKEELENSILLEMSKFTRRFTITYTGSEMATYKKDVEAIFEELKTKLNTTMTIDNVVIDTTMLYGMFNNVQVKATEITNEGKLTSVKLAFSFNYFSDSTGSEALDILAKELTGSGAKSILKGINTDVKKIKAIHDYLIYSSHIVSSNHSVSNLVSKGGGSSHAYALWTYKLLKEANIGDVRYVSGMSNGELHSWNVVTIGGELYHLDIADNDNLEEKSKDIKYRYFLAADKTIGGREIYYGKPNLSLAWGEKYQAFENIVNPAQAPDALYYANGESNSEMSKLDLDTPTAGPTAIASGATSGFGKIVYYEQTSKDTAALKYIYFINDAGGKYLYRYNTDNGDLQVIIKEPIKSIRLESARLIYTPINGQSGTLYLNQLATFNENEAKKVIDAITNLVMSDPPTEMQKAKVMEVRKLFTALTPEQRGLVTNIDKLIDYENKLKDLDSNIRPVIDSINVLDILDLNFVNKVLGAKGEFDDLTPDQKKLVYNRPILEEALARVNEAIKLNEEINKITVDVEEPFDTVPNFIKDLETVISKYEDLLPSLKEAIKLPQQIFMDKYSATAKALRAELQILINKVNIINIESKGYLNLMDSIEREFKALKLSQDSLLTDIQKNKINTNITTSAKMRVEVETFNQYMAAIATADVASIILSPDLVSDMKEAEKLYKSMKSSQIDLIGEAVVKKLEEVMDLINNIGNDSAISNVEAMIDALDHTKLSISELISSVTTADVAYIALDENQKSFISAVAFAKLEKYKKVILDLETVVTTIQREIEGLNDQSSETEIVAARTKYKALTEIYKHYVKIGNLIAQEARIQKDKDKELAQPVIDKINGLSDDSTYAQIKPVYDLYDKLAPNVKIHVTNSKRLLDLWAKVSKDEEAIQKAIDHVNNLIKALSSKSTRDDIQAVQDAYDALPEASQKQVVGYERIAELLAALDGKETELADQEAARVVEEKINALNDESTPTAIAEVRAAYEALSENAKKLVSKKMYDLLVFYENSMKEQTDQAKKEAQVIIDRINRITNSYTEAQIKDVRLAYNALSELAKSYVTNLQKLIDAERNIIYQNTVVKEAKLQAAAFDAYMANISRTSTTAEIAKARAYYNSLSYEAKRHVKTYEKLRRLETMWNDPDYLGLIFTYYPDYINAIKPGGIELEKPEYDSLYIPDDSNSFAYFEPDATWSPYEEMAYYNGRYTTKIEASQVKNVADKTMMLTAEGIELLIPTADIKGTSATVGVSMTVDNNKLVINFTEGRAEKVFSEFVEIRIPMRTLGGNSSMAVQRTDSNGTTPASYKVEGSNFVIRTKMGGTFTANTSKTTYSDLASSSTSAMGIRELAKRGITYSTSGKSVIPNKSVTRADVATLLAKALDVSSTKATKYKDLKSVIPSRYVQGLLEAGVMSGVTAQQFSPHSAVSRQEAAIIIANMYRYLDQDLSLAYNELKTNFRDVSHLTYEARQSIAILELFGVVDGTASRNYNPEQKLTRAQFAELLYKALNAIDYL